MLPRALAIASLLAAAACASPPTYPVRAADAAPAPDGVPIHGSGMFLGVRGTKLFAQWWRPAGRPRAVLVVVHGLKDHGSRYGELAARLVKDGVAVYAPDLRGHAHSEGMRVDVESFDDYLGDLDALLMRMKALEPGRPVFLLGHSMGGAIATRWALTRREPALAGLVLSGAALEADVSWLTAAGTSVVAALSPRAGVFDLDLDLFSRDPAVVAACKADPLVYQGGAPARTARALLSAIGATSERMEDVEAPLLVLHGSADRVTPPHGSQELHRRARAKDKTLTLYPGLAHDLAHEPEKARVLEDVAQWITRRAPPS